MTASLHIEAPIWLSIVAQTLVPAVADREPDLVLLLVVRVCLAAFLIPSALGKLFDYRNFIRAIEDYHLLPRAAARVVGVLLPWVELGLAVVLLLGLSASLIGLLVTLVLGAFMLAAVLSIRRGVELSCNCHVPGATGVLGWGALVRNCALLVLTLAMTAMTFTAQTDDPSRASWEVYRLLTSSVDTLVLAILLLGCSIVSIWLIEWTVEVHVRVARLSKQWLPEAAEFSKISPFEPSIGISGLLPSGRGQSQQES